jgi:hypothetical protein
MAEIIIERKYLEFYLEHGTHIQQITLTLTAARDMLRSSSEIHLRMRVDGWGSPWEVVVDDQGLLRAECPTCPAVRPALKYDSIISKSGKIDRDALEDEIMEIRLNKKLIPRESPKNTVKEC